MTPGDGGGALTAAGLSCGSCGTQLGATAKFCSECGAPVDARRTVGGVQAGDGAVRRRCAFDGHRGGRRCGAVARDHDRFGRPCGGGGAALRRHGRQVSPATASWRSSARRWRWRTTPFAPAWRRWVSRKRRSGLPSTFDDRDGVELQLRVGLNSGQVIAGEIGSGPFGYTAVGEQVGMAQRMESVAPPGGVMLSASTARLVEGNAVLGEPELVRIKGVDQPVPARRLLGMRQDRISQAG